MLGGFDADPFEAGSILLAKNMTETVRLLLSTCPYKLLRYCGDHVTHYAFDLKMADMVMVGQSFCLSFLTR